MDGFHKKYHFFMEPTLKFIEIKYELLNGRIKPCSGIEGAFKELKSPFEVLFDFISFTIF
jgi:hypothetical protein